MCEKCVIGLTVYKNVLAAFDAKYPNACKKCGGSGEVVYREDPGARDCSLSGGTMEFVEACPDCEGAEKPICTVCGKSMPFEDKYERQIGRAHV